MEISIDIDGSRSRGSVASETGLFFDLVEGLGDGNLLVCGLRSTARALSSDMRSRESSDEEGFVKHGA